jgi:hypothetical protein
MLPQRLRQACWLAALAVGVAVPLGLAPAWFRSREAPQFQDVRELQAWAERRGLYCRSDRADNKVTRWLAVATRPVSWDEANSVPLWRPGARRHGALPGVVWAANCSPSLALPPGGGACRVWGQVVVAGDPQLLDRIERGDLPAVP